MGGLRFIPFMFHAIFHTDSSENENQHCLLCRAQGHTQQGTQRFHLADLILATPTAQYAVTFPCLGKDTIRATAHHKWGVKELSVSSLTLIKLTREVDHKGFCRTFFSFIYLILNSDLTKKYFPQTYSTSLGLSLSIKKQCHLLIHLHTVHINHEKNNHCCLHLNYERFPRCGPPFQMTVLHL